MRRALLSLYATQQLYIALRQHDVGQSNLSNEPVFFLTQFPLLLIRFFSSPPKTRRSQEPRIDFQLSRRSIPGKEARVRDPC